MRALVVLSGHPPTEALLAGLDVDVVIAADGGGNALARLGRRPDVIVGDMDSVRADVLDAFRRDGVAVEEHPGEKRDTDGALAVDAAFARGARELVLVGSTGGRLDHHLANVHLVRRAADKGARVRLVEEDGTLWTVTPESPLDLDLPGDALASILPLTDRVTGVTAEGFRWPLADAVMLAGDPYGVSNRAEPGGQRVTCASGILSVVVPS